MHSTHFNHILQEGLGIVGDSVAVGERQLHSSLEYLVGVRTRVAVLCLHDVVHDVVGHREYHVKEEVGHKVQSTLAHELGVLKEHGRHGKLAGKELVAQYSTDARIGPEGREVDNIAVHPVGNVGHVPAHPDSQVNLARTDNILEVLGVDDVGDLSDRLEILMLSPFFSKPDISEICSDFFGTRIQCRMKRSDDLI